MVTWLKRILGTSNLSEHSSLPPSLDPQIVERFSHLEKQLAELTESLAGLSKISRRIHLSSDLNSNLLKEIQVDMKNKSAEQLEKSPSEVRFSERELLSILDSATSQSSAMSGDTPPNFVQTLLDRIEWQTVAEIDNVYHPTHCEVIETINDECEPGLVKHVIQQGYRGRQNQLIRRAKVIISKPSANANF